MAKVKAENYITIQGWMVTDLGLKGNELLLYALVYGFSQAEGCFTGGLQYVQDWLGCVKNTAIATLKALVDKGLIERIETEVGNVKVVYYRCKNLTTGANDREEPVQKLNQGGAKIEPNNKEIYKGINNNPPISPLGDKPEGKAESKPDLNTQRFESFWRMYPKKKDKQNAKKAWDKLKVDGELYNTIMRGLVLHCKTKEWLKEDGDYVPYPSTWLNGRRWEDEVKTVVTREPERPQPKKLRLRS